MRFLVDSSAWTMQAYLVLHLFSTPQVSLYFSRRVLQGIAAGIGTSNFLRRLFHNILEFLIIRINEVNTTQSSGIVELWFFDSPLSLLFAFRRFRHFFPNLWPQSVCVWSGGRLLSCQSPPRPCISIRWFFIQYSEPCETCPCIWQFSISINVPTVSDVFLQHYIQGCICSSGNVDIFQRKRKWFFLVLWDDVKSNCLKWTRNHSYLHHHTATSLEVGLPVWFSSKNFLFFSSVWVIPDWSGCSQNLISLGLWFFTFHRR